MHSGSTAANGIASAGKFWLANESVVHMVQDSIVEAENKQTRNANNNDMINAHSFIIFLAPLSIVISNEICSDKCGHR